MERERERPDNGDGLSLRLTNFSGPLEMLLDMVKKAEIEIKDIFLSDITDQFLSYMDQIAELDIDQASEYLEITANLLEIKSRALLPTPPLSDEEETPEDAFIRKLEEFKMLKEASEQLKQTENVDRLYRAPDESKDEVRFVARDMSMDKLLDAFALLLIRIELNERTAAKPKEVRKDVYTVANRIKLIQDMFLLHDNISFFEMFDEDVTKAEVVVTFSAILELMRIQYLTVKQDAMFGDLTIVKNKDYKGEIAYDD